MVDEGHRAVIYNKASMEKYRRALGRENIISTTIREVNGKIERETLHPNIL